MAASSTHGASTDGSNSQNGSANVCRRTAEWLRERVDDLVDDICAEMTEGVEPYRAQARTGTGRAELETNVRGIIELFLVLLAERRRLNDRERADIEKIGVQRGDQGFDLASIQDGVHIAVERGRRYLFTAVSAVAHGADALEHLLVMDRLLAHFHHDTRRAFETGYRRRQEEIETDRRRRRETFLRRLLEGTANGPTVEVEASAFDVPTSPAILLVAVQQGSDEADKLEENAARFARSIPAEAEGPIYLAGDHPHAVSFAWGMTAPSQVEAVRASACKLGLCVFASEPTALLQVHRAYHSLRALSLVAARHADVGLHDGRPFQSWRLITAAPDVEQVEYVVHVLGAAFADAHAKARLCQLRAFFASADGKVKTAATEAGKAEATIRKTLDRIGELTGYHPIRDRFAVELALRLYDHHSSHLYDIGDPRWAETP